MMPRTFKKLNEMIKRINQMELEIMELKGNSGFKVFSEFKLVLSFQKLINDINFKFNKLMEHLELDLVKVEKQEEHYEIVPKKKTNGRKT